jgi:hypothetical protein
MATDLVERLERLGVPGRKFWEDDLEMAMDPVLRPALEDGFLGEWIGKRPGRQVAVLCRKTGIDENGSVRKMKSALRAREDDLLPYLLVEHFAKHKSKVAVAELAKGRLSAAIVEGCQKENGEDHDTTALLFALFEQDPENLRLAFHLDKIHKTGFARMKLTTNPRKPTRSLQDVLPERKLCDILESFDKQKRDGRRSELKAIVPNDSRLLIFIRRAYRPDLILGDRGVVHGYRAEWIILDFDDGVKRVNISSESPSIPLEIANRIVTEYYGTSCQYDNESEITYAKQIERFLKNLSGKQTGDLLLVELVARNSPLAGSPKIKITDPDSKPIGPAIAHFEKAVGNLLGAVEQLESVKVYFKKKRVSVIFEEVEGQQGEYVVRYSDHRLNGFERKPFEDFMRQAYGIPVLSTEKRYKR